MPKFYVQIGEYKAVIARPTAEEAAKIVLLLLSEEHGILAGFMSISEKGFDRGEDTLWIDSRVLLRELSKEGKLELDEDELGELDDDFAEGPELKSNRIVLFSTMIDFYGPCKLLEMVADACDGVAEEFDGDGEDGSESWREIAGMVRGAAGEIQDQFYFEDDEGGGEGGGD